jgi:hypothetical protein
MKNNIILNMARCLNCDQVLASLTVHDFRTCHCGNLSVDGGTSYIRRLAKDLNDVEELTIYRDIDTDRFYMPRPHGLPAWVNKENHDE